MGYYDSTVESYNNQIYNNNIRISDCNQRIKQLEDDIEELRRLKIKVSDVDVAVTSAVEGTARKITNLPAFITNPFSVLKMSFFSGFLDAVNGTQRTKAKSSIDNAISKIDTKIRESQEEIERLRGEMNQCNSNINSLSRQKTKYIAEASAPKTESSSQATQNYSTSGVSNYNKSSSKKRKKK